MFTLFFFFYIFNLSSTWVPFPLAQICSMLSSTQGMSVTLLPVPAHSMYLSSPNKFHLPLTRILPQSDLLSPESPASISPSCLLVSERLKMRQSEESMRFTGHHDAALPLGMMSQTYQGQLPHSTSQEPQSSQKGPLDCEAWHWPVPDLSSFLVPPEPRLIVILFTKASLGERAFSCRSWEGALSHHLPFASWPVPSGMKGTGNKHTFDQNCCFKCTPS